MSRIAALKGKLGGSGLFLGGLKPGAKPPSFRKRKKIAEEKKEEAKEDFEKPPPPEDREPPSRRATTEVAAETIAVDEVTSVDPKFAHSVVITEASDEKMGSDASTTATRSRRSLEEGGVVPHSEAAAATEETAAKDSESFASGKRARVATDLKPGMMPIIAGTLKPAVDMFSESVLQSMQSERAKSFVDSYDSALDKFGETTGVHFAPIQIPLSRRRQTFAVLLQTIMFPICVALNVWAIRAWTGVPLYLYVFWLCYKALFQTFHRDGGLPIPFFRSCFLWEWFTNFFPVTWSKTCDLDADKCYIFGYHPHGIIAVGAWSTFAATTKRFRETFPKLEVRLLTLRVNFYVPFWDLFFSFMGVCDASRESCKAILARGESMALVLGGAKEALDAHRGANAVPLFLNERKGFVKMALLYGATLVPVFGFGENELYAQVANPKGSFMRKIQDKLQKKMGFSLPLFKGRGIFQYNFGLIPFRHNVHVAFGEPIECPKMTRDEISGEILDRYHKLYMEKLKSLYDANKHLHYDNPPDLVFV